MRIITLIIFGFVYSNVFSQFKGATDKIYLNDSTTVYEGVIIEQAPAKYVKIARIKENDTIQVQMRDIWKMLRINLLLDTLKKKEEIKVVKPVSVKNKYVYLELLGSAGMYSFNYDFRFNKEKINGWGLRAGLEFITIQTFNYSGDGMRYNTILLPFMVNYLVGKKHKFLELGFGAVYVVKWSIDKQLAPEYEYFIPGLDRRIPNVYGVLSVGYRRQPIKGRIMWGVSLTEMVGNSFAFPTIGLKLGYHIK
jgi:hypothetical protein